MNDEDLKEDLGVHRQQERRRLIAAIRSLKIKHGYDDDDDDEEESSDDDNDGVLDVDDAFPNDPNEWQEHLISLSLVFQVLYQFIKILWCCILVRDVRNDMTDS